MGRVHSGQNGEGLLNWGDISPSQKTEKFYTCLDVKLASAGSAEIIETTGDAGVDSFY